ncbi:hypothetical protein [Heliomarina baculiformis]|uniref:hypothetical protein n=1 Tax=Heliomarina baculiformis TaxID=2872036 RepID=UPI001EE26F4E|nr:hypothetical protein [Heliomarina baculiformis]
MDEELTRILKNHDEYEEFVSGLRHETKRGAVLVAHCVLDDLLDRLVTMRLDKDNMDSDQISALRQSLKNFASKTALSQGMGLTGKVEAKALLNINKVRNWIAHDWRASFQDAKIIEKCQKLPIVFLDENQKAPEEDAFDRFRYQTDTLIRQLIERISHFEAHADVLAFTEIQKINREYIKVW